MRRQAVYQPFDRYPPPSAGLPRHHRPAPGTSPSDRQGRPPSRDLNPRSSETPGQIVEEAKEGGVLATSAFGRGQSRQDQALSTRRPGERQRSPLSGPPTQTTRPPELEGSIDHVKDWRKAFIPPHSQQADKLLHKRYPNRTGSAGQHSCGQKQLSGRSRIFPAAVSETASQMASSSPPRPDTFAATAADLWARRSRQQPAQTGLMRTISSSDFRAIPENTAASDSPMP